ncbi:DUF5412 family protein [Desulfosporosinus sp. HMP52]|uniref:DUF5412 family protein n=1 Tax=Desulfosporosinus sp. HMP52 TaxID=1487923 RepID=UPI00249E4BD7|nr:DUF5412 family protein [Desulfosporosinus sp. HMP52]
MFTSVLGYGVYRLSYDLDRLPKGTLIAEETSPNKTYAVKAYTSDAGATTSYSVIAELSFNKASKPSEIIYFQYKESAASIRWQDDSTVIINNVELHMPNEKYDYRHNKKKR